MRDAPGCTWLWPPLGAGAGKPRQQNQLPLGGSHLHHFHLMTFAHSTRGREEEMHKPILGLPLASPQAAAPLLEQGLGRHQRAGVLDAAGSTQELPFIPSVLPALPLSSSVLAPLCSFHCPCCPLCIFCFRETSTQRDVELLE